MGLPSDWANYCLIEELEKTNGRIHWKRAREIEPEIVTRVNILLIDRVKIPCTLLLTRLWVLILVLVFVFPDVKVRVRVTRVAINTIIKILAWNTTFHVIQSSSVFPPHLSQFEPPIFIHNINAKCYVTEISYNN
jgi:hypothetical protein